LRHIERYIELAKSRDSALSSAGMESRDSFYDRYSIELTRLNNRLEISDGKSSDDAASRHQGTFRRNIRGNIEASNMDAMGARSGMNKLENTCTS
jgi:hypothetical protein